MPKKPEGYDFNLNYDDMPAIWPDDESEKPSPTMQRILEQKSMNSPIDTPEVPYPNPEHEKRVRDDKIEKGLHEITEAMKMGTSPSYKLACVKVAMKGLLDELGESY